MSDDVGDDSQPHFRSLPLEVVHHIFSFLPAQQLAQACALVDWAWAEAIADPSLWRTLAIRDFSLLVNPQASLESHSRQLPWCHTLPSLAFSFC